MTLDLPPSVDVEMHGDVGIVRINRPEKRNALDDETVLGLGAFFSAPPPGVKAVVLEAVGDHFSAGLDLSQLSETSTFEGVAHSAMWHQAFQAIEFGKVPVVSVLKGAVIGGGLELATATHIRVAEPTAFYALPEGQRGLFVGGGASVRVPRLIGVHRMMDLMLTGRVLSAEEGFGLGLSQYLTEEGSGLTKALGLATAIAENSPVTNFAVMHALPKIAAANPADGYLIESLMAAISQGSDEAKQRMQAFLDGKANRVREATA